MIFTFREFAALAEKYAPNERVYVGALISIHGMNTFGEWQEEIAVAVQDAGFLYRSVKYGYELVGVLWRATCQRVVARIGDAYVECSKAKPVHLIGHSYGTLAIARSIEQLPDMTLGKIVLFGSIVRRDYPWDEYANAGRHKGVLNETCPNDPWPRRARTWIPGSGPSGCCGFHDGASVLEQAYGYTKHGRLATAMHCRETWLRFLRGDHLHARDVLVPCPCGKKCPSGRGSAQ